MKNIVLIVVFAVAISCLAASYLLAPSTDDIPYTVLDDSSIESYITKSYLDNGNLIIDIYNPNCEIVKVKPATIKHHVTAGMDSVKIFNYTDQYFEVIVGNASDVYTFGSLTKTWDAKNKTVIIGTSEGEPLLTIERVSTNPDLCTFEEVLNITSYVNYELNNLKDFRSRWRQYKGTNNITSVDWYIQKNQSYDVVVPEYGLIEQSQIIPNIIEYKDVTTTWSCGNCALGNCNSSQYWNISRNTANGTESGTICFDRYEVLQANPLKIKIYWNKTGVVGSHNETNYYNVWKQFSPVGKTIRDGQSYIIKVVYHKPAELGDVRIQTIPLFRGVECDELTWWNTSWSKKVQLNVNNSSVALTDFQLMKNITYDSDMNVDFSDLRFVNESNMGAVPYWVESKTNSSSADIWLNISSISTTTGAKVWMYYGNAGASDKSNGDDTFEFFDDFPGSSLNTSSKWTVTSGSQHSVSSGVLTIQATTGATRIRSQTTYGINHAVHMKSLIHTSASYIILGFYNADGVWEPSTTWMTDNAKYYTSQSIATSTPYALDFDSYHIFDFKRNENTNVIYSCDGEDTTVTTNLPTGDLPVGISQDYNGANYISIEYVFVRKCNINEPTWAADGAEEDPFSIISYAPSTPVNKLESESQYFNVTTDENCQCRWYINGSLKQTNTTQQTDHNYTNTSLELGYFNFSAVVNTSSGMIDTQTWWVTVDSAATFKPPEPTNLANTTGNFWVNHTWQADGGNVTDGYNVTVNGEWHNRTYPWYNGTYSAHDWQNISVWAWNNSGVGTMSD